MWRKREDKNDLALKNHKHLAKNVFGGSFVCQKNQDEKCLRPISFQIKHIYKLRQIIAQTFCLEVKTRKSTKLERKFTFDDGNWEKRACVCRVAKGSDHLRDFQTKTYTKKSLKT